MKIDKDIFLKLGKESLNALERAEKTGRIRKQSVSYIRKDVELQKMEKGQFSSVGSFAEFERQQWSDSLIQPFIERDWDFKHNEIFQEAVEMVSSITGIHTGQATFWLSMFVNSISNGQLNKESTRTLEEWVDIFATDLLCQPKEFRLTAHLVGIWISEKPIEISGIKIRRPKSSDFEEVYRKDMFPFAMSQGPPWHHPQATTILEFKTNVPSQSHFLNEYQRLITALRLFRLGSVDIMRHSYSAESILQSSGSGTRAIPGNVNFTFDLESTDAEALKKFLESVSPLIPEYWFIHTDAQTTPLSVAYRRYVYTLFDRGPVSRRLSFAVMGLEALFLGGDEMHELRHKLSQRCAKFMSGFGYDAIQIYEAIRKAYKIRSKFVHGAITKQYSEGLNELTNLAIDLLRKCIVSILLIIDGEDKKTIIALIDKALLGDEESSIKIAVLCQKVAPFLS